MPFSGYSEEMFKEIHKISWSLQTNMKSEIAEDFTSFLNFSQSLYEIFVVPASYNRVF